MPKGFQNGAEMDVGGTNFPKFSEIDETWILNDPTALHPDYWCSACKQASKQGVRPWRLFYLA